MRPLKAGPPFDAASLRKYAAKHSYDRGAASQDTIDWLLRHNSAQTMVEAIRAAWKTTSLPLRVWADLIAGVRVEAGEEGLQLVVTMTEVRYAEVRQAAPFTRGRLSELGRLFPMPFPRLIEELALAAPGLSLEETGVLASPRFFVHPLAYLAFWLRDESAEEVRRRGFEFLDRERRLIEAIQDGAGNLYVINRDGSVAFMDHETWGLVPCNVGLEDVVEAYFTSPESIVDPYAPGWAKFPEPVEPIRRIVPVELVLSKSRRRLTHLACLAWAVRGCQRAMPGQHLDRIPRRLERTVLDLEEILEGCKQVVISGVPLAPAVADRFARVSKQASDAFRLLERTTEYRAVMLTFHAIPPLAQACAWPEDTDKVAEAGAFGAAVRAYQDDLKRESSAAAFWDAEYLLGLSLGEPGTLGRPVPLSFFERPLWPDGSRHRTG